MTFITKNIYEKEKLPWSEYIPENADKIILGTFPTKKDKRDFEFFYPNKNNKFWKVLANISNCNLTDFNANSSGRELAIRERKHILNKLKLAITDIGAIILRQNNSSLDSNLFPIEFTDIFQIIQSNPSIKRIILTSSTKGNSVLSWFEAYCKLNNIILKI